MTLILCTFSCQLRGTIVEHPQVLINFFAFFAFFLAGLSSREVKLLSLSEIEKDSIWESWILFVSFGSLKPLHTLFLSSSWFFRSLESSSKILGESWSGSGSILVSIKASSILESDVSDGGLDNLEPEELKRVEFALNPGSACITSGAWAVKWVELLLALLEKSKGACYLIWVKILDFLDQYLL